MGSVSFAASGAQVSAAILEPSPAGAWLSFAGWCLTLQVGTVPLPPLSTFALGPYQGDLSRGLGKMGTPIPAGRPALAEHQICISKLKHALFPVTLLHLSSSPCGRAALPHTQAFSTLGVHWRISFAFLPVCYTPENADFLSASLRSHHPPPSQ